MTEMSTFSPADGHLFPTSLQRDLILAAISSGRVAVEHFERWRAQLDIEAPFEWQMARLLPRVYLRLLDAGYQDPLMPRLKGVYRKAWAEAQHHRARAIEAVSVLADADIPVLLTKGLALGEYVYGQVAARPMSDVDLVVPRHDAAKAVRLLRAAGWTGGDEPVAVDLEWFHARQLFHRNGGEVDVHWRVMIEATTERSESLFWERAQPVELGPVRVFILDAAEQFLHTVVHGVRWNEASPMRWIVDAAEILHRSPTLSWSRVVELARELRVSKRLLIGMRLLSGQYGQVIPDSVFHEVEAIAVGWRERLEAQIILADRRQWSTHFRYHYWDLMGDYVRVYRRDRGVHGLLWDYPRYVSFRMGLDGRRQLLSIAWRGVRRRLLQAPKPTPTVPHH